MGKSKKTRWRTFSFDGSKDETPINGDVKANVTDFNFSSVNSQKYSQILGDHHHSNYLPHTKSNTANHNNFKARNYNKENHYNQQRSAAKNNLASKNSWQRNGSAFRATVASLKDSSNNNNNKSEENGKTTEFSSSDKSCKQDCYINSEPIKFNEDEYTRITTPRQDVLFKKGYLSRMNSNKTANNNNNNTSIIDSTGPNSTSNSDPESSLSVSTLSPATTPSMDYCQMDSQDFTATTPIYYPGYYDESGMLVFPMYNGYNYYPQNGSTPPVYLMPYPYQFDPFFMAPNTEVPANDNTDEQQQQSQENENDNEDTENKEKEVSCNGEIENNQIIEGEQNNEEGDEKDVKQEQGELISNEPNEQTPKQCFPIYANELGYIYPYTNGFYNGFYYYNGIPGTTRPSKGKRRKRYSSSRSSNSYPPPPRSTAETTTDYSDDDGGNSTHNRRYYTRYNHHHHHNAWNNHYYSNVYNQYHYNSKYHHHQKSHFDQNANQAPSNNDTEKESTNESNLNADVVEFYPRVHSNDITNQQQTLPSQESNSNVQENDLEKSEQENTKSKSDAAQKSINNTKPSHTSKPIGRVTKKEIMDGIKLMEQQNINLKATSKAQMKTAASNFDADVEWNVIKKGKKVKIVKDSHNLDLKNDTLSQSVVEVINKDSVSNDTKLSEIVAVDASLLSQESVSNKKTIQLATSQTSVTNNAKSKKSKNKNKKKKPFTMTKQDGFKIIEPDFSSNSSEKVNEEIQNDSSEEDAEHTVIEEAEEETTSEKANDNNTSEFEKELIVDIEDEQEKKEVEEKETNLISDETKVQDEFSKVFSVEFSQNPKVNDDDAIIDISDEEICRKTSIEMDLSIAQEIARIESETITVEPIMQQQQQEEIIAEKEETLKKEEESLFEDSNYFNDRKNIAELERDLIENLKCLDDGIDIKSPIINPLYDFPITSAVRKWLQEKQHESFENLFRVENFKKLSELYDECEDDDDDDESDISDSPQKSETTDSDYASDIQVKLNGSPASSNAKLDTKVTSKCNNKLIVKESFCALM
ncbi:hypothetical protein PVAND_007612 [Polypedilum vanderplanki]|uniref:Uncharacterized protein n=1 Tax=Polypedilum vanderplanki TaxID=319348 RepID=A0A9J6C7G8_POLVA|nr:hypothetical protein PVAND_007612 [Polypedilum vanderplanki]